MKVIVVLLIAVSLVVACATAQGATVYKLTFDHGDMANGPADYTAVANEILPAGVHGVLLNSGATTGNLITPDVAGAQGGQALNMMLGASWPNKQGYFFGNDPVANGDNYGTNTYPLFTTATQIGSAGPTISNEYTLEVVVRPDFADTGFGIDPVSPIFDSQRYDGISGGACLSVDQRDGSLVYQSGAPTNTGGIIAGIKLISGTWYNIAVVVKKGSVQRTELWVNGELQGTGGYPGTWETQGLFKLPGYFTVGTQYWPMGGRNWQGQIDAIAISDTALAPGSFVFDTYVEPPTPEPIAESTIYKITFDHGVMNPGPADYTAAFNEKLPTDVHGVLLQYGGWPSEGWETGNLINPNVPGMQGGQALNMMMAGAWPNKQGYFFGNDPVANGDNYGTHTYLPYACPDQIGSAGPLIANEYTLEAIVRPNYSINPIINFGLTAQAYIFDAQRLDFGDIGGPSLYVDQNDGTVVYRAQIYDDGSVYSNTLLQAGTWYHIAAVVRKGATQDKQRTELWINGVLDGTGYYAMGWETMGYFNIPGYFTIGTCYYPLPQRNFQGQIDAVTISNIALDPSSFVLAPMAGLKSISGAKTLDDADSAAVKGTITAAFDGFFYVEDPSRCSAIRVVKDGYAAVVGNAAIVSGMMGTLPWGERQILADSVTEIPAEQISPLGMNNKSTGGAGAAADASGLNNVGLLVKTTGSVGNASGNSFNLDDGSGVALKAVLTGSLSLPTDGSYLAVTGIITGELVESQSRRTILVTDYQSYQ